MGPDGEKAIALVNNHIYQITVPKVGAEAPSVSVQNPDEATFPVKKLTTVGGAFTMWGPKAAEVNWSLGNSFFRYNLAAAKAFQDSAKKAPKGGEKKKDEDAEEPMYEPAKITVELEAPRYKGTGTVVFRGARILTMKPGAAGDSVIENGAVIVTDNRIVRVGPSASVETPRGAREINVTGKTIIPGFVDTHAHMWPAWGVHREVVWEYLKSELDCGHREKNYWSRHWQSKMPSSRSSFFLGTPYPYYRLPDDQIERFIESGDLLQSATMFSVSFPIYNRGNLIGTVAVRDREGEWAWYRTGLSAGSADTLAIAFQKQGCDVSLVGADHLGDFLVCTPHDGAEKRVYFMYEYERRRYRNELDARGTMSYPRAMEILQPVARKILVKRQSGQDGR